MNTYHLPIRPKRLRKNATVRAMVAQTHLRVNQLIAPLFISETLTEKKAIASMPGQFQLPLCALPEEIDELVALGIPAVILFGIPKEKDATGSASLCDNGIIQQAVKTIKAHHPKMLVITDVCLCEYTSHGHCGILQGASINNDETLAQLAAQAISHAKAGADWVAPSSMTDGMVGAIREALDAEGFQDTAILSYAVKYSSAFYGPFREAAQGAPQFGDRKSYQMHPGNGHEALREAQLDIEQGADLIMVKPAQNYLDVIFNLKQHFPEIPLCAYQVSGEFAMIKHAAQHGLLDEKDAMIESLTAIKRAGADIVITYFAKAFAKIMNGL